MYKPKEKRNYFNSSSNNNNYKNTFIMKNMKVFLYFRYVNI